MYIQLSSNNLNKDAYQEIWKKIQQDLIQMYGESVFNSWFKKIILGNFNNGHIILVVPTQFVKDWITANYFKTIFQLWYHYDQQVQKLILVLDEKNISNTNNIVNFELKKTTDKAIFSSNLDPRFTFENFIIGKSNKFAYTSAHAIAESNETIMKSNPLFIYGGVGLGKTHLMHAIAWHIKQHNTQRSVIYMSAEKFMYKFVNSLRNKNIMYFKEQFRSVDVLMIDDIQFICGKDSTQEEFFHTFNALMDENKLIIISCDRPPSELDNIENKIKSRLGGGLVVDIQNTTYELRLDILCSKVGQININIPNEVVEFLATKINSNVRELEGALNKVLAYDLLACKAITLESTKEILHDLLRANEKFITIEEIQKKVAEKYNIKISDMLSTKRSRGIVRPRQIAMYIAKLLTTKSLVEIGKKFGKKDHTTVIHAINKVDVLYNNDCELKKEIDSLINVFKT